MWTFQIRLVATAVLLVAVENKPVVTRAMDALSLPNAMTKNSEALTGTNSGQT